jgi:hypothetical protein
MRDEKRITVRLSGPLYRVLDEEARRAGQTLSEYLRTLVLERKPHLAAFVDVGQIMAAGKDKAATPADYAPYLMSMERRLQAALADLEGFETRVVEWKLDATRELKAALGDVQAKAQQMGALSEMAHIFGKVFAQEDADETR